MSFPTVPAFLHYGDWSSETQAHPAMKFMEAYTNKFDTGTMGTELPEWHVQDFSYYKSDGTEFKGVQQSFDAIMATYGALSKWRHEPYYVICHELKDGSGWEMIGQAKLYANFPVSGEQNITDNKGEKWEASVPGAFHFTYKKDPDAKYGVKLARTEIQSDSGPLVIMMLQKGMLKPADLGLA